MGKYIEAEVFKAKIMNYGIIHEGDHIPIPFYKEHCGKMFTELLRWVCEEVDDAFPADVQEVQHGKWVDVEPAPHNLFYATCSVCGDRQTIEVANYCPNCGAKMDGDTE